MGRKTQAGRDRARTDRGLRAERRKTDVDTGETGRIDEDADRVVDSARHKADEVLGTERAEADAEMKRAGASSEARDAKKAEQATDDVALAAERRAADRRLQSGRDERHRAIVSLFQLERDTTDELLGQERDRSDEGMELVLGELAHAVRLREQFFAMASHELNTPLTPLVLGLESLAREAAEQPESAFVRYVISHVNLVSKQTRRLTALVANLLDVAQMSCGLLRLDLQPVDLGALVREVVDRHRIWAAKSNCAMEVEVQAVVGHWDALRLEQTVTNLLENALKYGVGGAIHLRLERLARLEPMGDRVRLTVRDEGIGISHGARARLFGSFQRAVSDENYGGFGVGLYICRTSIEALGGTISVESEPGRGSTFTVDLPLSGRRPPTDDAPAAPGRGHPNGRGSVPA